MRKITNILAIIKAGIVNKKTPLVLLVLGQAYSLYIWQMETYNAMQFTQQHVNFLVSALTAFAIDLATVQITFSEKQNKMHWSIAFITSITLTALGIAISYTITQDALHSAFPIGIFLYSWFSAIVLNHPANNAVLHIAHAESTARGISLEDLDTVANAIANNVQDHISAINARIDAMQSMQQNADALNAVNALQTNALQNANAMQSNALQDNAPANAMQSNADTNANADNVMQCPNCNADVSKGSYYRVQKRGYCSKCKTA